MNENVKNAILQMPRRAEDMGGNQLMDSFVDVGTIITALQGINNTILYGRRGTGKTHIFKYLKSKIEKEKKDCCIYIDLRTIGSTRSLNPDSASPIEQRAISIFRDIFKQIHDQMIFFIESNKDEYLETITPLIENLLYFSNVPSIDGTYKQGRNTIQENSNKNNIDLTISSKPSLNISTDANNYEKEENNTIIDGHLVFNAEYLDLSGILIDISKKIKPHKIWFFFDEFSAIQPELQLYLSDMIKRVICPIRNCIFKIAAIEHSSVFMEQSANSTYYKGLELSADCFTVNLDDIMVVENNQKQAFTFFQDLLFRHINSMLEELEDEYRLTDKNQLKEIFKGKAFEELVLASEGVPRDAINILARAFFEDYQSNTVSVKSICSAAQKLYNEDKLKSVKSKPGALDLLQWIIETVIGKRQARAFLLKSDTNNPLINYLYEARILHIIKQNATCSNTPGIMYDVYSIDYGCYVHLKNSKNKPKGLFEDEKNDGEYEYCQVPKDDYRSIKKAILNIDAFYQTQQNH